MVRLNWRDSIFVLVDTGDIVPFYGNVRRLVEIESRGHFSPVDFNLSAWNDSDVDELAHEIFLKQIESHLRTRLTSRIAKYSDAQWNKYFTIMIRHHLLQKLQRNRHSDSWSGEIELQSSPSSSLRFEMEENIRQVLNTLSLRQRRILKGQCEGKTLDEISREIKTIKKSAVHKAKQELFDLLREAGLGEQDLNLFISVLCDLLGASLHSDLDDKGFPTVIL
jgi:DNA-directed RNA polymerase specialized sigma24 family protein